MKFISEAAFLFFEKFEKSRENEPKMILKEKIADIHSQIVQEIQ